MASLHHALPPEYTQRLSTLQDRVAAKDWPVSARVRVGNVNA